MLPLSFPNLKPHSAVAQVLARRNIDSTPVMIAGCARTRERNSEKERERERDKHTETETEMETETETATETKTETEREEVQQVLTEDG